MEYFIVAAVFLVGIFIVTKVYKIKYGGLSDTLLFGEDFPEEAKKYQKAGWIMLVITVVLGIGAILIESSQETSPVYIQSLSFFVLEFYLIANSILTGVVNWKYNRSQKRHIVDFLVAGFFIATVTVSFINL